MRPDAAPLPGRSSNEPTNQAYDHQILTSLAGVDDSKRITATERDRLLPIIKSLSRWAVGAASAREIDNLGIVPAVSLAACRAYRSLGLNVDLLLCDRGISLKGLAPSLAAGRKRCLSPFVRPARSISPLVPELSLTRGDSRSLHIAAASIIAKVTRDRIMQSLDARFSGYGFADHKGYGTAAHISALRERGPSPLHRNSFHVKS